MSYKKQEEENSCPFCESSEWKMASLVYAEGISTTQGSASSSGIGISSGGIGVGSSKGEYSHFSQSELSLKASPPASPSHDIKILIGLYTFLLLILYFYFDIPLFFALIFTSLSTIILYPLAMFFSYLYVNFFSDEQDKYEIQLSKWRQVKMCLRCGLFFNKK